MWGNLGSAYYWAGDGQYKDAYTRAVDLIRTDLKINSRRADVYGDLALYEASLGKPAAARAALRRASADLDHATPQQLVRIGHVYELLEERGLAIEFVGKGVAAGFSLDELHRMPRFKQLLASPEWQRKKNASPEQ